MNNPLKTLSANERGRDFVIGDLHGARSLLTQFMEHVKFDPTVDRILSCGDLIDRGEDSLGTLELLNEPWFHCVLANHEQMMLEAFEGGYMGQFWFQNGGEWGLELFSEAQDLLENSSAQVSTDASRLIACLGKVAELPYLLTVSTKAGKKFHLIHAEISPEQTHITDEDLADPEAVRQLATVQSRNGDFFVWGRHLFSKFFAADLADLAKVKRKVAYSTRYSHGIFKPELSHIISGHTIVQRPLTILGQTDIDTAAYAAIDGGKAWYALTAIELDTWTFYQTRPSGVTIVEPVVVNSADIDKLNEPRQG